MHNTKTAVIYGFLIWLVPFIAAVPFYSPDGEPLIDIFLFKTIMIVVGALIGAACLVRYFRGVTENHVKEGVIIGCLWLAMNWGFDLVVLVPLNDMALGTYFTEIGLRYLTIPIFSIAVGMVLQLRA